MKNINIRSLLLALVAILAIPAQAGASKAKLSADLERQMEFGAREVRAIVTYDEASFGRVKRAGANSKRLELIGAIAGSYTIDELRALAADPRVLSISPDRLVNATMDTAIPAIGADRITDQLGYTGRGVTVALIART